MQKSTAFICLDARRRANEVFGSRERTKGASSSTLLTASEPFNGIFKPALITTSSHLGEVVSGAKWLTEYL